MWFEAMYEEFSLLSQYVLISWKNEAIFQILAVRG